MRSSYSWLAMNSRRVSTGTLLLLSLTLVSACNRTPTLRLNARPLTTQEILTSSSVVIVGKVVNIQSYGEETQTAQRIRVKKYRVVVKEEYKLSGNVGGAVTFYLYDYAPSLAQNGNFEWLGKGDRRVLFLKYDGPIMRSVTDLYGTSMLVQRRGTPDLQRYDQSPVGQKIARFFLTPAANEQARTFAQTIPRATEEALKAGGYEFVASLLQELMRENSPEIRDEACVAYYEQLFGDDACLKQIEASAGDIARRVIQARQHREYLRGLISEAIRSRIGSPLARCYVTGVEPNDPNSRANFFRYLITNPDPIIRLAAEREISASSPGS
jgi:hypothetical protein